MTEKVIRHILVTFQFYVLSDVLTIFGGAPMECV
jgi:hypothetical protein